MRCTALQTTEDFMLTDCGHNLGMGERYPCDLGPADRTPASKFGFGSAHADYAPRYVGNFDSRAPLHCVLLLDTHKLNWSSARSPLEDLYFDLEFIYDAPFL
jgi:hypothetical protein